jgi:hypothetical protein
MKTFIKSIFILVISAVLSVPSFGQNKPVDPAGKGNGILGFGFGPGIGYYGGDGFGPAILFHYDHSIWEAGPGTISLGGQIGTSFFVHNYPDYKYNWVNMGYVFRGAYHYGWKVPGLDTYAGFGVGTWISIYNDNGHNPGKESFSAGFLPTAFFGASYFFNDVVGVNAETGYNFAYISIGLNFRLVR